MFITWVTAMISPPRAAISFQKLRTTTNRSSRACHAMETISSRRGFHSSPIRRSIDLIEATSGLIQGLHNTTHMPWALTLPLMAILVRLTVVLPLSIYTRRAQQRQLDLQPILQAWQPQIRSKTIRERGHLGPAVVLRYEAQALRGKRRELYKRWNCGWWKNYLPLLQLPVFLLAMESIRSLSGSPKGLLGMIWSGTEVEAMKEGGRIEANQGMGMEGMLGSSGEVTTKSLVVPTTTIDSAMATEGALWFPDLTAADPMLILPFMLSATMLSNHFSNSRQGRSPGVERSVMEKRVSRILAMMALAVGPLTLQFPSAMLLYWISGSMAAQVQSVALDRFMPLRRPPAPCKLRGK